jgi:hypothetical protein
MTHHATPYTSSLQRLSPFLRQSSSNSSEFQLRVIIIHGPPELKQFQLAPETAQAGAGVEPRGTTSVRLRVRLV